MSTTFAMVSSSSGSAGRRSRRRIERIRPLPLFRAHFGGSSVFVADLSLTGAGIEHQGAFDVGSRGTLTFEWEGEPVSIGCTVLRCRLIGFSSGTDRVTVYSSGLEFDPQACGREHPIRRMIAASVRRALEEQKANARGIPPSHPSRLFEPRDESDSPANAPLLLSLSRERGFCSYRYAEGRWRKSRTNNPEQPPEGFTVWASEDADELEQLCRLYERCDESMRYMIRMLAQLSVSETQEESHRRYVP